jgi:hypothetical protein
MSALARLAHMPDWPARMTADVAAAYMGISKSTFLTRYGDVGVREGSNVLWARRQLDAVIAKQFALPHLAGQAAPEINTWGDLR